jgi:hypothetical protein
MIQRILDNKVYARANCGEAAGADSFQQRDSLLSSAILGLLLTLGVFNRISFPTYVLFPSLYLIPHFFQRYYSSSTLPLAA